MMGRKESARRWVGMISPGGGSDVVNMQKSEENWHGRNQKKKINMAISGDDMRLVPPLHVVFVIDIVVRNDCCGAECRATWSVRYGAERGIPAPVYLFRDIK